VDARHKAGHDEEDECPGQARPRRQEPVGTMAAARCSTCGGPRPRQ
jgi:hypothetical protein